MRTSYLALATAGCLWGTSFLCGKIAFRELSVAHMLLYRFLFASIGPVPFVWLAREPMPEARLAGDVVSTVGVATSRSPAACSSSRRRS